MTDKKKDKVIDPKTGKVCCSSQYDGNDELDKKTRASETTKGGDDIDKKYSPDQEELKTEVDEADQISNVGVEGRRTREDDLSENPSKDK